LEPIKAKNKTKPILQRATHKLALDLCVTHLH